MAESEGLIDAAEGAACPVCGDSNPSGNRFCGSRGSPLQLTCPACGTANPPANRFCGSCGTSLTGETGPPPGATTRDEPAPEIEERKVVTILFADLTGSTELATSLDAEDLRPVLTAYFTAMS